MMPGEVQMVSDPVLLDDLLDYNYPDKLQGTSIVAWQAGKAVTWQVFRNRALALATILEASAETRWSLVCHDGLEFAIGLMALARAGKTIILPQNPQQSISNCRTLLSDNQSGATKPTLTTTCTTGRTDPTFTVPLNNFQQSCLELYTSGSSGTQKCIPKTWQQINSEIRMLEACFGKQLGTSSILGTVPHYHIYGLLFRILWPLAAGRAFISQPGLLADEINAVMQQFLSVTLVSSPAHLKRLPTQPWPDTRRRNLITIFSSGGPLPAETAITLQNTTGKTPVEIYGSTETGGIAWRQQANANEPWQPLPGVQIKIDNRRLSVCDRWTHESDWMDTGDCAIHAPNGQFELLGRVDDVLKIEDKRISLAALEALLLEHPFIETARLLVLQSSRQTIAAVIVLTDIGNVQLQAQGKSALQALLRQHLAQHYETITLPRRWRFVEQIPLNAMGKHNWQSLTSLFNTRND